ncbi:MAG: HNH endonuclease, partial [Actinomycetota bacterium]|nr:HNH endonuclease [Actinomycetota bacterium]
MEERDREPVAGELEAEIARTCGVLNAASARLVSLLAQVLEAGAWQVSGVHSATQWVAWQCGVSPARARSLVSIARRRAELPVTSAAFDAGELCEDQVAVIARHAPAGVDAEVADLARSATVTQLRRVLGSYPFAEKKEPEPAQPTPPEEARSVSFGQTESGSWRLSAELPPDEGALVERALVAARDELFHAGEGEPVSGTTPARAPTANDVSWADAFVAMAERSMGAGAACRPHHERHLVLLHVEAGADGRTGGHLHLGPALGDGLRRFVGCDIRIRPVIESGGRPVSVGRAFRTVPDRTRTVIEDRDRGCRVPGCDRSRWLHVHHIEHWEDGGTSDTPNLL